MLTREMRGIAFSGNWGHSRRASLANVSELCIEVLKHETVRGASKWGSGGGILDGLPRQDFGEPDHL